MMTGKGGATPNKEESCQIVVKFVCMPDTISLLQTHGLPRTKHGNRHHPTRGSGGSEGGT